MMNVDNDEKERVTDLGLALGYSNYCIQKRSKNDSGAGVNAVLRLDMTFVASDPLSELVWSPQKGLSLKCADCSLAKKKSSFLWDVGPSNMILSPPQSITSGGTNDDKPIDERNVVTSQVAFHVESEVGERESLARSPRSSGGTMPVVGSSCEPHAGTGGNLEEINTLEGVSPLYINQNGKNVKENEQNKGWENQGTTNFLPLQTDEPRPGMAQSEQLSGEFNKVVMTHPGGRIGDVANGSQTLGFEVALASKVHTVKQSEASDRSVPHLTSPGRRGKELSLLIDEKRKTKTKIHGSTCASPLKKLECTAENDLQLPINKDGCGQSQERAPRDKSVPLETSPNISRIHLYKRKGKEKALSDGDFNDRISTEEDDSHESVESCNSGLFSTGKRRWSFEQQLIVGSKRVKKQIQESSASTSLVRQDNSFMNWISNMVKGLTKSNQDEAPSLALTFSRPDDGHESHDPEIITCNKKHDSGSRNMGFQTIFQSLYCSNIKVLGTRMPNGDYPIEGSKELVLADEISVGNITPIAFHEKNEECQQFLLSGDGEGPSTANIASTREVCKTYSAENKTSSNLACGKARDGVSSSGSSLGKHKTSSAENNNSDLPFEGKAAIHNIGCRSDPLGSLWITRFSSKSHGLVLNLDHCSHSTSRMLKGSADCTRLIPHTQNCTDFSIDHKSSEAKEYSIEDPEAVVDKELQNFAPSTEASSGFKRIHGHNEQKSLYKLNPLLPSQKLKSSEAMPSMFARRFDALNHIIPSDEKDDATCTMTCLFCGKSGHDLRDCSEVTETEMEGLLRNITPYDGAKESPCLCIRCFQLNHWAVSCPMASSSRQLQSEYGASLVNHYGANKIQLTRGNERYTRMLETEESHPQVAWVDTICTAGEPQKDTYASPSLKWNGIVTSGKMISNLKHITSNSGKNELKENQTISLCNFVKKQISDVPKGMFDALRRLRLCRTDILKWMNSQISLSHLNGFFLRLRLGKWEEGLGGTGYYVACITGAQREKPPQYSKYSISVNVGDIKCLVKSQYVSNHDFLEDELMAWWCTTLRSGGKIPSEDDLKLKIEERKRLGF